MHFEVRARWLPNRKKLAVNLSTGIYSPVAFEERSKSKLTNKFFQKSMSFFTFNKKKTICIEYKFCLTNIYPKNKYKAHATFT